MVKWCFYLLCFCWLINRALEATPIVEASIDSLSSQAHFPLEGTITITHSQTENIDPQSFKIEGQPLEVSFEKEIPISSDTLVTIYHFELPPREKGLYLLPSISVKIKGQVYQTISSSYTVKEATADQSLSAPVEFRLEAQVQGPITLYPGERTKLLYHIFYNRSIDLTRSILPMIHPVHFKRVGDVHIYDYQKQNITIQELIQEVEALDVGHFQLGPSFIEGYTYTMRGGQKVYDRNLLKSQAPAITLDVKPFPLLNQPPSFTGALGQIKAEAHLKSSATIFVGDTLQLEIQLHGMTNLEELRLPLLECQPGFSGFFQMSDLPPLAKIKDDSKIFHVELRPLVPFIHQIPSIEVSSFDSSTEKYHIQRTPPIPLHVETQFKETISPLSTVLVTKLPAIGPWPTASLAPLEMKDNAIQIEASKGSWIDTSSALWLLPLGISLLFLQAYGYRKWQQRPKPQIPKSEELLQRAFKNDISKNLYLLEQAFWNRLWEKQVVPPGSFQLNNIPQEGNYRLIHSFIFQLQVLQYSAHHMFNPLKIKDDAQELFDQI